jgi:uncharacterized lipoprotein YddW (UPF0748 family)
MNLLCALFVSSAVVAQPNQVVLVKGSYAAKAGNAEATSADEFFATVRDALKLAGVEFSSIEDEDVAAGKLSGASVAIFPYTPRWAPGEAEATVEFIRSGGKVIVFYVVPSEVAAAIGADPGPYKRAEDRAQFHEARLAQDAPSVMGLPRAFINASWNIHAGRPIREDCKVLYEWFDADGHSTGDAALLISQSGAYMTHILTDRDLPTKARVLLALLGQFIPTIWPQAAQRTLSHAWDFDEFHALEELESMAARAEQRGFANQPRPSIDRARQLWGQMQQAVQKGMYPDAIDLLGTLRAAAIDAYSRCQPSTETEMRAVWIHTAFGVGDWGWEKSIRHLKEMGFNAILPNMLWGGVAYYHSDVLPVAQAVAERGDQVAECAKWCRHYGVELHVWKVNWNLGGSRVPADFVERLRAENRLQRDPTGKEILWLCPSDDRNFELERASMIELVQKYDIAGIHFDYIRYPGMNGCYCERCRKKFEESINQKMEKWPADVLGGPYAQQWLQFRRDNITRLVKRVYEDAHRIRPDIKVSAAVFGYWNDARDSVGQDWVKWIDEGWLDFVCPMDYIPDNQALRAIVTKQTQWVGGRIPLYVGLGEWRLKDAAHLTYQIKIVRELGADGFVLFHYDHPEITDQRMPALRLGVTKQKAMAPHVGPRVEWTLPPTRENMPPRTYLASDEVHVGIAMAGGAWPKGVVELRSIEGRTLRRVGEIGPGESKEFRVSMRSDPCRLAVVGRNQEGQVVYERRSPTLWSMSQAEYDQLRARMEPPKFGPQGLRVGVYAEGYGAEPIATAAAAIPGIQVRLVYAISEEMLKPCQVFILPQPRSPAVLSEAAVQAIRQFAMQGGYVIATHDAVGFRLCPVVFPEVCTGGTERVDDRQWRLAKELPDGALEMGKTYTHTFYDHILVGVGPQGEVIATDLAGRALVVQGWFGKGRFCACGIGLGIGAGNGDVPLSDAEQHLLRGLLAGVLP